MSEDYTVETRRKLRRQLKATLIAKRAPKLSKDTRRSLEYANKINPFRSVADLGKLPIPLQYLFVLEKQLNKAAAKERHRRCVNFFGKEDYDNERIEYKVYCEVNDDPRFNQGPKVARMLERRIRRLHPELTAPDGHEVVYFIDIELHVHATDRWRKTKEEFIAEIEENSKQIDKWLAWAKENPEEAAKQVFGQT